MTGRATAIHGSAPPAGMLRDLVRYRDLWWDLTVADARLRYAGSVLGPFWSVLHPLIVVVLLVFVFSHLLAARGADAPDPIGFAIGLCAGFLPWMGLQEIVVRATTVFRDQANLVKKVAFPPVLLHAYVSTAAAINLGLLAALAALVVVAAGRPLPPSAALWPVIVVLQLLLATGLGLGLSVANVFLRDVSQLVVAGLQLWFWLTPILYPVEVFPQRYRLLLRLNPLYLYVQAQHDVVRHGRWLPLGELVLLGAMSGLALLAGATVLRRLRRRIPDEL